jgi:hypothetical protein
MQGAAHDDIAAHLVENRSVVADAQSVSISSEMFDVRVRVGRARVDPFQFVKDGLGNPLGQTFKFLSRLPGNT